jgi:dissimilatory sulfite reductase (desulfoviridin) alpha/beta subunit
MDTGTNRDVDTGTFEQRGALIAARIRTAAEQGDRLAQSVINQAVAVADRWRLGDIPQTKRDGMEYVLRTAVACSGYAEEAYANRDTPTIAAAVSSLVNTALGK